MRNTQERIDAVHKQATELKRRRAQTLYRATVVASGSLSLVLIVLLAHWVPMVLEHQFDTQQSQTQLFASVFSNSQALSYVVIGTVSFLLGICVTFLCVAVKRKRDEQER